MDRMEEVAVEMRDVVKEMGEHMPECFLWNYILLAAVLAIMTLDDRAAVEAILLFALRYMGQRKIFLKISTKNTKLPFFFVPEQLR